MANLGQVLTIDRELFRHSAIDKCDHCGGYTYNDSRGNCAACGARRLK